MTQAKPDTPEAWAFFLADLHLRLGPGVADVARRFAAGEIPLREKPDMDDLLGLKGGRDKAPGARPGGGSRGAPGAD